MARCCCSLGQPPAYQKPLGGFLSNPLSCRSCCVVLSTRANAFSGSYVKRYNGPRNLPPTTCVSLPPTLLPFSIPPFPQTPPNPPPSPARKSKPPPPLPKNARRPHQILDEPRARIPPASPSAASAPPNTASTAPTTRRTSPPWAWSDSKTRLPASNSSDATRRCLSPPFWKLTATMGRLSSSRSGCSASPCVSCRRVSRRW